MTVGKVPSEWMKFSYPCLKSLSAYLKDLGARVNFINEWVLSGQPVRFWASGFYFVQGFLTAVLQNYARKHVIAIDTLDFDYEMKHIDEAMVEKPEDGCLIYGLFLEGARFNYDTMALDESEPRQLFAKAPTIYMRPC